MFDTTPYALKRSYNSRINPKWLESLRSLGTFPTGFCNDSSISPKFRHFGGVLQKFRHFGGIFQKFSHWIGTSEALCRSSGASEALRRSSELIQEIPVELYRYTIWKTPARHSEKLSQG